MEGLEGLISLRELVLDRNKIKVISSQPSKQFGACIFKIFMRGRVGEIISVPTVMWLVLLVRCWILIVLASWFISPFVLRELCLLHEEGDVFSHIKLTI